MNGNKKMKTLGSVMLIIGAIINIIPELFSSIASVIIMACGLYLLLKNGSSKGTIITSIVFNGLSLLVCGYCLAAQYILDGANFKLGSLPMDVTCFVSIALTLAIIVFTIIVMKKRDNE